MSGPFIPIVESQPDDHSHDTGSPPASPAVKFLNALIVTLPVIALAVATSLLWKNGFDWTQLWIMVGMYVITGLGITIGYHRLFTHKSFECGPVTRFVLGVMGSMGVEGPLFKWVATHRQHHQHSDRDHDPHSPHQHGEGVRGLILGAWHAHVGWIFEADPPNLGRYIADLRADPVLRFVDRFFVLWVVLGFAIPTILGGVLTGTWTGAGLGFLWGGLVRMLLLHHVTWSINSVCHLWGSRPFRSHDHSRNHVLFGILGLGEGWHNNHHAFPTSARHGLRWWQFDISYIIIRAMSLIRLVWNVRTPSATSILNKRATPA